MVSGWCAEAMQRHPAWATRVGGRWGVEVVVMRVGSGNPGGGKSLSQGKEVWDLFTGVESWR